MKLIFPGLFAIALVSILLSSAKQILQCYDSQPDPLDIASQDSSVRPQDNFYSICKWNLVENN